MFYARGVGGGVGGGDGDDGWVGRWREANLFGSDTARHAHAYENIPKRQARSQGPAGGTRASSSTTSSSRGLDSLAVRMSLVELFKEKGQQTDVSSAWLTGKTVKHLNSSNLPETWKRNNKCPPDLFWKAEYLLILPMYLLLFWNYVETAFLTFFSFLFLFLVLLLLSSVNPCWQLLSTVFLHLGSQSTSKHNMSLQSAPHDTFPFHASDVITGAFTKWLDCWAAQTHSDWTEGHSSQSHRSAAKLGLLTARTVDPQQQQQQQLYYLWVAHAPYRPTLTQTFSAVDRDRGGLICGRWSPCSALRDSEESYCMCPQSSGR